MFDFKSIGVTEILALLSLVGMTIALCMGNLGGEVYTGGAIGLVTALGTLRRVKEGQKIKAQAGTSTLETEGANGNGIVK